MLVQMAIVSELQAYTFCGYTIKHPVCSWDALIRYTGGSSHQLPLPFVCASPWLLLFASLFQNFSTLDFVGGRPKLGIQVRLG